MILQNTEQMKNKLFICGVGQAKYSKETIITNLAKKCRVLDIEDLENNKDNIRDEIIKSINLLIKNGHSIILPNVSKESIVTVWVLLFTHFKRFVPSFLQDVNNFILSFKDNVANIKSYLIKDGFLYNGEKYFQNISNFLSDFALGKDLSNNKLKYKNCIFAFNIKEQYPYFFVKNITFGPKILQGTYPILNIRGMKIICNYYKKKYNIDLSPYKVFSTKWINHSTICDCIGNEFEKLEHNHSKGIIFWDDNHALPIILSNINHKKHLIILDTNNIFLRSSVIANEFLDDFKLIEVWAPYCKEGRQADIYSCVTDALVILKDLLRTGLHLIFDNKILSKPKEYELFPGQMTLFRMPEMLLKTAQVSKYLQDAEANLNKIIGKNKKTLGQIREENSIKDSELVSETSKLYNRFTVNKTKKYLKIIEKYPN